MEQSLENDDAHHIKAAIEVTKLVQTSATSVALNPLRQAIEETYENT